MKKFLLFLILPWTLLQAAPDSFDLKVNGNQIEYLQDSRGNRILDFSYCGYESSGKSIPDLPVSIYVQVPQGDATQLLQAAIDKLTLLKPDANGFRGALLLEKGEYKISESLFIRNSGIVIRGAGTGLTKVIKTGPSRSAFVRIEGASKPLISDDLGIEDDYIPVNSRTLQVKNTSDLRIGDRVIVYRPSTEEWIKSLYCDVFGGNIGYWGWHAGDADLQWDRQIVKVKGNIVELDAPLTMAVNASEGKAQLFKYEWKERVEQCGVENLSMISEYDLANKKDEDHAWTGISIDNARNCWVRKVNLNNLAGSGVILLNGTSRITVEDCMYLHPVSEFGGFRRDAFFNFGQLNLFQRCYSEQGMHDFAAGYGAPGPNAFVQCESYMSRDFSGATDTWAPGLLFDLVNIDGNDLVFKNIGIQHQGAGWTTANSMFWQCSASGIEWFSPNQENKNRSYGCWAQFDGDGQWAESNNHVHPRSLFAAQLQARLGRDVQEQCRVLEVSAEATSSPTIEEAAELTAQAKLPKYTLKKWIEEAPFAADVQFETTKAFKYTAKEVPLAGNPITIENGKLVHDGKLLTGGKLNMPWWNSQLRPAKIEKAVPAITRFVPGRFGQGYTDDLDSVVAFMNKTNMLAVDQHYSLWYDRRRDDHERIRRKNGDVWGPFYEQAFARYGGEETAWDGLSKYDLNKPNQWYWYRLRQFADIAGQSGKIMQYQHFFQHNIIEAGAHYVDSPWRTANNINDMGLPEPVHFAGDKRIFYADMFYDLSYPGRKEAFRNYIRTCLDEFNDKGNVIHFISDEFTGPLHFVQFWLDVIAEWQQETGADPLIALSVTKDVQDAILEDPVRSKIVDMIDIRYWHPRQGDSDYAPEGGKSMAPRQFARKMKVGKTDYQAAYRAVKLYREKYPSKAVVFYAQNYPSLAWAVFMAGGSCPVLNVHDKKFLQDAAKMHPLDESKGKFEQLVNSDTGNIIFSHQIQEITIALKSGNYALKAVDLGSGEIKVLKKKLKIKDSYTFNINSGVYWLEKL